MKKYLKKSIGNIKSGIIENLDMKNLRHIFLTAIILVAGYFYTTYITLIGLLTATFLVSVVVNRYEINRLGIELATFSTILSGITFGPEQGALLGIVFITIQLFTGKPPGIYMIWVIPSYGVAGYVTGHITGLEVDQIGLASAVMLQAFFSLTTLILMRNRLPRYLQYAFFNIVFNAVLFTTIGGPVLNLLN